MTYNMVPKASVASTTSEISLMDQGNGSKIVPKAKVCTSKSFLFPLFPSCGEFAPRIRR